MSCKKIPYATRKLAVLALRDVRSKRRREGTSHMECVAYRCHECGNYHLSAMRHTLYLAVAAKNV